MGRCAEFGSEIAAGCEHPMVAGAGACACPDCGTECRGLFRGCAAVWANGPVDLPRPKQEAVGSRLQAPAPAQPAPPAAHEESQSPGPPPANGSGSPSNRISGFLSAVAELREDLRLLHEIVERERAPDPAVERLVELVDELPSRVSAAVMGALADVAAARTAERAMTVDAFEATPDVAISPGPTPPA